MKEECKRTHLERREHPMAHACGPSAAGGSATGRGRTATITATGAAGGDASVGAGGGVGAAGRAQI